MVAITVGRIYTLLFFAIGGLAFSFFLPTVYRLQGNNLDATKALWLNKNTRLLVEHTLRLYGHALLGGAVALLTNYLPLGIVVADVLSGISWIQRYNYGLINGMPNEMTTGAFINVAVFGIAFVVNLAAVLSRAFGAGQSGARRAMDPTVGVFNGLLCGVFGVLHYFYFPFIESKQLPAHGISWYLTEGQTVVSYNFQLVSAVYIVFGLLSLVRNHRHPLPFAIGFSLMAAVEWMKFNTYAAPMFNAWEPNRVSLLYFVACVSGALLNFFDAMFIPATTYRERPFSLQEVAQSLSSKTANLRHAAERAADSLQLTAEKVQRGAEAALANVKGKEEMHDDWNDREEEEEEAGLPEEEDGAGEIESRAEERVAALDAPPAAIKHKGKKQRQKQHKAAIQHDDISGRAKVQ